MNALKMIGCYQGQNAGLSAYMDGQLQKIRQAIQESYWRRDEDSLEWSLIGVITAEKLTEDLLRVIYIEGEARTFLEKLYAAITELRGNLGKNRPYARDYYLPP